MSFRDVTGSPPVRGASRAIDMIYPANDLQAVGNAQGINCLDRQGIVPLTPGTITGFGVPPAGSGYTEYRGRIAYKQTGSGTSGGFYTGGSIIYFAQNQLTGNAQTDLACWRVASILAMDSTGLGAGDTGLEVGANLPYNLVSSAANPGFRVGPTAANQISVQVRQNGGGGFTINQVVQDLGAGTVDDWHMYEMRFIGATQSRDAVFRVLIDGVVKASFPWGAGTLLPTFGNGASLGYFFAVGNRGATVTYIAHGGTFFSAAPNEQALL